MSQELFNMITGLGSARLAGLPACCGWPLLPVNQYGGREWAWLIAALAVALLVIAANNVRMARRA